MDAASSAVVTAVAAMRMNASAISADSQTDRFIVRYKVGTTARSDSTAVQSRLDRLASAFPARARHARRMGLGADVLTIDRKLNAKEAKAFMRAIASDPDVEYVEPDIVISATSAPNDPLYSQQWGLFSNLDPSQPYAGIRVSDAWKIATGAGITIGVVDNGLTGHSDLDANVIPAGYDFTFLGPPGGSNPGIGSNGRVISYHGTHVAGIMAAVTSNGIGISGIAPSAKLVSARSLNQWGGGLLSSTSDALIWASGGSVAGIPNNPHPASVINLSLEAVGYCAKTFQYAIDDANSRGATVVVAAGNDSADASNVQPANCRGVIAVGNTQKDGSRSYTSNYGLTVDIAAPGTDILSTWNDGTYSLGSESYALQTGTSMAAPMVSGVVALIKSVASKQYSAAEMRTLITQHSQPFPKRPDQPIGAGILDASAAVAAARSGEIPAAADFICAQGTVGMLVTCTDLSTARGAASIRSWAWNMGYDDKGDTVSTESRNSSHDYEYPGTYNVSLTITDSNGAVSRVSRPITVVAPQATDMAFDTELMFSGKANVPQYYKLELPSGAPVMRANLSSRSSFDSGMMFVKAGSPTSVNADCSRYFASGSGAQCFLWNPRPGTYYLVIKPASDVVDTKLFATFTP